MNQFESTAKRLASAFAVLAVWMLAVPAGASAEVSHDALWGNGPDSCLGPSEMNVHGLAPLMSKTTKTWARSSSTTAPGSQLASVAADRASSESRQLRSVDAETTERVETCLENADPTARSHQICLENVDVPASVVPTLVAEVRAFDQTENVLAKAHRLAGADPTDAESAPTIPNRADAPKSLPLAQIPTPPNQPDPTASCTASNPEECRNLPPRGTLNLESSPTPPRVRPAQIDWDDDVEPADEEDTPAGTVVGPAEGYDDPPMKPPQTDPGVIRG